MPRKRTIYQSEAIFAGPTGVAGTTTNAGVAANNRQLNRVQSANYNFEISREDVNQFGNLAAIDRIILEQPTVSLDVEYYANSGENEVTLGLAVGTDGNASIPALASILQGASTATGVDIKNYYILTTQEGYDANNIGGGWQNAGGNVRTLAIGNASLTSYEVSAAVGEIPTVSFSAEGLNMSFINGSGGNVPTINQENGNTIVGTFALPTPVSGMGYSALRPGDIQLSITGLGVDLNDLKVQSASISVDISRDPIEKLGSRFAFAREITFPLQVTMDVEAVIGEQSAGDYASLSSLITNDPSFTASLTFNRPGTTTRALKYTIKQAKLDSQEFSSAIGDNKSVSMSFSTQIGGPNDSAAGLFIDA